MKNQVHRIKTLWIIPFIAGMVSCHPSPEVPEVPVSRGNIDFPEEISSESNEILNRNTNLNKSVVSLVAFTNLITNKGLVVSGDEICGALDELNPTFKSNNTKIYKSLNEIQSVFKREDRLYLVTKEDNQVDIDQLRVRSGSNITVEDSGKTLTLNINEGITVGWKFLQFDLNHINVDVESGTFTFNYGNNKEQTVNINEIIK